MTLPHNASTTALSVALYAHPSPEHRAGLRSGLSLATLACVLIADEERGIGTQQRGATRRAAYAAAKRCAEAIERLRDAVDGAEVRR